MDKTIDTNITPEDTVTKTMELIRHRRSVRTFDGRELCSDDMEKILSFAQKLGNPYDLPIQWRILNAKEQGLSSPVIYGTDIFIAGKMHPLPHAEEAFGFAFEKIVLYAESLGVGTTWIAGTMNRVAFEKAMGLEADEVMPCVSPLGYPATKMSLRETLMRKGVKADSRLEFSKIFFEGSFDRSLEKESAGELEPVLEMVQWAPSAVNKQPWRLVIKDNAVHFYEKKTKGYVNEKGWDLQKIDMGIVLCHFDTGLEAFGRKRRLEIADPGISLPEEIEYIASYVIE